MRSRQTWKLAGRVAGSFPFYWDLENPLGLRIASSAPKGREKAHVQLGENSNPFSFNLQIVKDRPELPIVPFCLIIKWGGADPGRRYSDEVLGLGSFHWQRSSGIQTGF